MDYPIGVVPLLISFGRVCSLCKIFTVEPLFYGGCFCAIIAVQIGSILYSKNIFDIEVIILLST
jgi:hypothetical protein